MQKGKPRNLIKEMKHWVKTWTSGTTVDDGSGYNGTTADPNSIFAGTLFETPVVDMASVMAGRESGSLEEVAINVNLNGLDDLSKELFKMVMERIKAECSPTAVLRVRTGHHKGMCFCQTSARVWFNVHDSPDLS